MGDLVNELLAAITAIPGVEFANIYNQQFDYIEDGGEYSFPLPCVFLELDTTGLDDIGGSLQGSDIGVIIHIGQNDLNSAYMEQNLTIFQLRDNAVIALKKFQASTGSLLVKVSEGQDYNHSNVYHYVVSYKMHFIDTTTAPEEFYTAPPSVLNITTNE